MIFTVKVVEMYRGYPPILNIFLYGWLLPFYLHDLHLWRIIINKSSEKGLFTAFYPFFAKNVGCGEGWEDTFSVSMFVLS
jgi:hypothetical protein